VPTARERFIAKCEFMPASGCVLWRGGTTACRDKTDRTGVFWDRGKKHLARRWAAEHIHGIDLLGKETSVTCGDQLCVQHIDAQCPVYPNGQFYVLRDLGYCELPEPPPKPDHTGPPMYDPPAWLRGESEGESVECPF
jgi:hypothetical protein